MEILKKALVTIAIILIIFASSVTIAVTKSKGKVITETLRLRKEASVESTVLDLLSKDDEVEIVAEEGDWYKVNFKTYTGYVSKEYISKNDNSDGNSNPKQDEDTNGKENNEDTNKTPDDNTTQTTNNDNNANNKELANKQAKTNSDLNVYILPLINSNIIGNLKQNTKVDIVNITGVWAYVKTETLAGWIRVDKISITDSNATQDNNNNQNNNNSDKTTSQNNQDNQNNKDNQNSQTNNKNDSNQANTNNEKQFTPKNYYIKSSAVNVRAKSTTSSSVVTTLNQNTQVKAIGEEGDWYKVEVNGKSGYILKSLLSANKVEVTSRSSNPERQTTNKTTTNNTKTEQQTSNNNTKQETSNNNSSKGEQIVAYAKQFLGRKYVYGGSGPNTFDCSGFTMYVYKHFGYSMGHSAVTQAGLGKYVSKSNLQPGDLVIFNDSANRSIGHVGIYVGGGKFIHASSGSGKIIISSLSGSYYNTRYVTGRRVI